MTRRDQPAWHGVPDRQVRLSDSDTLILLRRLMALGVDKHSAIGAHVDDGTIFNPEGNR